MKADDRIALFAACPTYDQTRYNAQALADLRVYPRVAVMESSMSLLARNFNQCWAVALNARAKVGVEWFLLLHADVVPLVRDWLPRLIQTAQAHEASVLSAVIPLKTPAGLTSTGIDTDPWHPRRFTMTEVYDLPETFTRPDLVVNTGMLLVNFRQPWVERICFTILDRMVQRDDGMWEAESQPEDWHFSRQARALGVRLWATRAIPIRHYGTAGYDNTHAWGTRPTDLSSAPDPEPAGVSA